MEKYILPIKLNEYERQYYADWGLKKEKLLMPVAIIFIVLFFASIVFQIACLLGLYPIDYTMYKSEMMGMRGEGISFINFFTSTVMLVIGGVIVKITDFIFELIHKAPDFVKYMQITMDLDTQKAVIEVMQKKRTLKKFTVDISDLPEMLNTDNNCITIENTDYFIGNNTIQSIYPKDKQKAWLDNPGILPRSIAEVKKIREIIDGIKQSILAEQKARQWEKVNNRI